MIAVLDFGSQYTHLITRRIRQLGVSASIFDSDISSQDLKKLKVKGIILSGGPGSVSDKNAPKLDKKILEVGLPVLGICYGHQLIAHTLGGEVKPGKVREYGEESIHIKISSSKLFAGLSSQQTVWFSHGDEVTKLPPDFICIASTSKIANAAMVNEKNKIYAIQFHVEVAHTPNGMKILENFIFGICKHPKDWKIGDLKSKIIDDLRKQVGGKKVLIGVSGGVDSLVSAKLLDEVVKDDLYCLFIDSGFMRKKEPEEVRTLFSKLGFKNFILIDAAGDFLKALKGIVDPEEKRKAFAKEYFKVFEQVVKNLKIKEGIEFLGQGTIYPDRIEAAKTSKVASLIKSHHNVTLPEKLGFKLIEPLSDLYKDEVRDLGKSLGLSESALERHPFPGPGLLIRILGEITKERLDLLREADYIFIEELKNTGQYNKIWQALAALLPVKSVGVMGDERTYEYLIALRAVTSVDAMTADWARIPENILNKISKRITNEIRGVNRVLYDITQKPPATIEYE